MFDEATLFVRTSRAFLRSVVTTKNSYVWRVGVARRTQVAILACGKGSSEAEAVANANLVIDQIIAGAR